MSTLWLEAHAIDEVDNDDESHNGDIIEIFATERTISHEDAMVMFEKCQLYLVAVPARSSTHNIS